ncbi:MAG: hypothetical protein LBL76_01405 [Treponema sp.]|nr:hypothetical protein [Treponema sp.]
MIKSIIMDQEMAYHIHELAKRERRSFSQEALVLIEQALWHISMGTGTAKRDRLPTESLGHEGGTV